MRECYLAIDIGATKTLLGIFNQNSEIIYKVKFPTCEDSFKANVIEIKKHVQNFLVDYPQKLDIVGAGIGIPAIYDNKNDVIQKIANLSKWKNTKVKEVFKSEINTKLCVHADVYASLTGEKIFGSAKQASNFVNISVGTGIGMGIFINDSIYIGDSGNAGGIGHTIFEVGGYECNCGKSGCLENYVCGMAMERMFYESINQENYKNSLLYSEYKRGKNITSYDIIDAASLSDQLGIDIVNKIAFNMGITISNIIMVFDPEAVILNGGIILNSPPFMLEQIKKVAMDNLYPETKTMPVISITSLGEDANLYGNYWIIKNS